MSETNNLPEEVISPLANLDEWEMDVLERYPDPDAIAQNKSLITLRNMGNLNSPGAEFAPVVRGEELVFTASRKETTYKNNGQPMLGLYKTKLNQKPDET